MPCKSSFRWSAKSWTWAEKPNFWAQGTQKQQQTPAVNFGIFVDLVNFSNCATESAKRGEDWLAFFCELPLGCRFDWPIMVAFFQRGWHHPRFTLDLRNHARSVLGKRLFAVIFTNQILIILEMGLEPETSYSRDLGGRILRAPSSWASWASGNTHIVVVQYRAATSTIQQHNRWQR